MITTVLLVIISAIVSSYFFYQSRAHYKKYEKFYNNPTPLYIPLLGNTYLFFNKNLLVVVQRIIDMCGKRLVVYVPHRTYITSDPEEIKIILNEAIDKSKEYNHLKSAFGNSLLLAKAQIWKKHRKIYSKSFKQNILNSFVSTFYHKSNILIDILKRRDYEDIYELFEKLTLDIFQEATIGTKSSIMVDNDNYFVSCITEGQRILFNRIGNVFKMHDFIFFLTNEGKMLKDVILNRLNNFLEPIIQEKRIKMKDEIILNSSGLPLLDLLLTNAQKEKFTNEFVCNEILLFASAATDTTAYSLAYILCLLAMHPLIQQKVYEEVISVIGEGEITSDHILKLKYTEMAIKEALRLLPPIPLIGRQVDCDLDIGTCVIPKDTGVAIPIINLHRDETIYPNPLVYDPNRFLPENVASRHPYSFIPFSEGPRNCIGWKYALMSLKVSTANIIRTFQITTPYKSVTELKLESSVVMNTTHPLDISFIPR